MDSILNSIKKLLGISTDFTNFDQDIIMHINSVFMVLNQLGVGPKAGFRIEDSLATWDKFVTKNDNLEAIKSYMYLKVKLMFDPPLSTIVMEANKQMLNELEWRLNVAIETKEQ